MRKGLRIKAIALLMACAMSTPVYAEPAEDMATGWYEIDGEWHYYSLSGWKSNCWLTRDGKTYYLNEEGIRQTGWLNRQGKWYYFDSDGVLCTGWVKAEEQWYYLDSGGVRQSGWLEEKGKWYFLAGDGHMTTGWKKLGGKWYFFKANGCMTTGWIKSGKNWYYLDKNSNLATDWNRIGGKWYYFDTDGRMLTDTWIEDDYVGPDGVWDKNAVRTPAGLTRLSVSCIRQKPELPNGCEVTSLAIVLNYLGYDVSKLTLSDQYLDKGGIGTTSPYDAFIGNPRYSSGWYCYSPVIARCGNKYLATQGGEHQAVNITGSDFDQLLVEVDAGRPVIFWGTLSMSSPSYGSAWIVSGTKYTRYMNLHCLVLTGYDREKDLAYVSDPLQGNRSYKLSTVKTRYEQLGKQAVVIRKAK